MTFRLLFFPFALIIFIWSFVSITKPTWSEYQTGKDELRKLVAEKQTLVSGIENIKKALAEFKQIDDDSKQKVYNALPEYVDNDNLVAEINKNASQSGVVVLKIGASKSANRALAKCKLRSEQSDNSSKDGSGKNGCSLTAQPIGITMSILGSYPMIKDFLTKMDKQNRVILPQKFVLSIVKTKKNSSIKQEEWTDVADLVNAKINFDVFQKEKNSKIVLSKAIDNDRVLKSLLTGGIEQGGLKALQDMITGELFYPVSVNVAGKEDLFKSNIQPEAQTTTTQLSDESAQ